MPMTTAGLKAAILSEMTSKLGSAEDGTKRDSFADAIASAVVNYIKTNAAVTSTVAVTSVSGVTTGPGVSGPGAGTATGTIA